MKSFLAPLTFAIVLASNALAEIIQVTFSPNNGTVFLGEILQVEWQGGESPYTFSVISSANLGTTLGYSRDITGHTWDWIAAVTGSLLHEGTSASFFQVEDAKGDVGRSETFAIHAEN